MITRLLSIFFLLATLTQAQVKPQIVGGVQAVKNEAPYLVSLQVGSFGHFCAGTLISSEWVLTAAHCVDGKIDRVVVGLYSQSNLDNAEVLAPYKIYVHPEYSNDSYDFALIRLNKPSKFTPIKLTDVEPIKGNATVFGWGDTSEGGSMSDIMRKVTITIVDRNTCNSKIAYNGLIDESMICAGLAKGGKDSCQGDSGGSLVFNGRLAGVVSWGYGCARPNKYGVYSNVWIAKDWIHKVTGI